ncbi:hypothetical protein OG245_18670 [Streptomyces sp. NBC_01116]|uniref:hypothetical protein n=1 Tax=Streptomyces sp. NBC_01116 TaxID=2903752 RepID=UPI00324BFFA4
MARVVDEALLAGVTVVAPPAPRAVGAATTTAASATAARAVAPAVGAPASAASLGRAAGLSTAAVRAIIAVRLGRRFGR